MYPIENDIAEKIETFTTNLLNGNIKDFYPDIIITDVMPDGYNMNGDGIIIPKSIFLNETLLHKKKAFLSQYNNVLGYSDKELLATYYYYVLCHEATHKARNNDGYDLTNPQEEKIADDNAVELTISRFNDVFCLYLSVLLCNIVDQQESQKNIKKYRISQETIDKDSHYTDKELLEFIKSKGSFTSEQEKIINSLNSTTVIK